MAFLLTSLILLISVLSSSSRLICSPDFCESKENLPVSSPLLISLLTDITLPQIAKAPHSFDKSLFSSLLSNTLTNIKLLISKAKTNANIVLGLLNQTENYAKSLEEVFQNPPNKQDRKLALRLISSIYEQLEIIEPILIDFTPNYIDNIRPITDYIQIMLEMVIDEEINWCPRNVTVYTKEKCPSPWPDNGCPCAVPGDQKVYMEWNALHKKIAKAETVGISLCSIRTLDAGDFDCMPFNTDRACMNWAEDNLPTLMHDIAGENSCLNLYN